MSCQEDWPTSSLKHVFKSGYVVAERCERNRRTHYAESFFSQRQDDVLPARTVCPRAMDYHDRGVLSKRTHSDPPSVRRDTLFPARNLFIASAISTTCVSIAKWPVSRNSTSASGTSFRNAFAPAGMKNGSFLPQIASNGGLAFRK